MYVLSHCNDCTVRVPKGSSCSFLLTQCTALQVIIATWMLHIEVDRKAVDSVMELLDSDVRTV